MPNTNSGYVYVISNFAMPGLVKVGQTANNYNDGTDVRARMQDLSSKEGVPENFRLKFAVLVNNYETVERVLHSVFKKFRTNLNREFFTNLIVPAVEEILRKQEANAVKVPRSYALQALDKEYPNQQGIVCVASNRAMPKYHKVAITDGNSIAQVRQLMDKLNDATGVPIPFECEYASLVESQKKAYHSLTGTLVGEWRLNRKLFSKGVSLQDLIDTVRVTCNGEDLELPKSSQIAFENLLPEVAVTSHIKKRLTPIEIQGYEARFRALLDYRINLQKRQEHAGRNQGTLMEEQAVYGLQ